MHFDQGGRRTIQEYSAANKRLVAQNELHALIKMNTKYLYSVLRKNGLIGLIGLILGLKKGFLSQNWRLKVSGLIFVREND